MLWWTLNNAVTLSFRIYLPAAAPHLQAASSSTMIMQYLRGWVLRYSDISHIHISFHMDDIFTFSISFLFITSFRYISSRLPLHTFHISRKFSPALLWWLNGIWLILDFSAYRYIIYKCFRFSHFFPSFTTNYFQSIPLYTLTFPQHYIYLYYHEPR